MFKYDVFLSHAAADAAAADQVRDTLIAADYEVYCDRYDDPQLDRTKVSAKTADVLRDRMRASNVLIYVVTPAAHASKWMPWELGFFDGVRGKVLVYPVDKAALATAKGQEYLRLFSILRPGDLEAQLKEVRVKEVRVAPARANDFEMMRKAAALALEANPLGMLLEKQLFGPGDQAQTVEYGGRIRDAFNAQDFDQIRRIQLEVWKAWFRIWGFNI